MSIAQVTPGTYDYGAYANPTQVKVDTEGIKLIGEAVGKGVSGILKQVANDAERKNALKRGIGEFNAYAADSFAGANEEAIFKFSESYSEWIKNSNKLFRKDKTTYYQQKAFWESNMNNIKALKDVSLAGMPDVDLDDIKSKDFQKYLNKTQIANGSYLLDFDPDKGFNINLSNIEFADPGSQEFSISPVKGIRPSEKTSIGLTDFLNKSDSYTGFKTKFNTSDPEIANEFNSLADILDKKHILAYTTLDKNNREYLDVDAAIQGVKGLSYIDDLIDRYGQDVNEDMFDNKLDDDGLRTFFASNLIERATFVGDKIPDKSPSYADVTQRMNAETARIKALKEKEESVTSGNWRITKVASTDALSMIENNKGWITDLSDLAASGKRTPKSDTQLYRILNRANYAIKEPILTSDGEGIQGYIIQPKAGQKGIEESLIIGKNEEELIATLKNIFETNIRNANTFLKINPGQSAGASESSTGSLTVGESTYE